MELTAHDIHVFEYVEHRIEVLEIRDAIEGEYLEDALGEVCLGGLLTEIVVVCLSEVEIKADKARIDEAIAVEVVVAVHGGSKGYLAPKHHSCLHLRVRLESPLPFLHSVLFELC